MRDLCELFTLAAGQHSLVAVWQANAVGFDRDGVRHLVASGRFTRRGRYVLAVPGVPDSPARRAMQAVLACGLGSVLSHIAAAAWWGLPGFDLLKPIHVTRARGVTGRPAPAGVKLHQVVTLLPQHITVLNGIPVVRPERLILEICGSAHPLRAERALDNAWSRRLLSGDSCRRVLDELAASGRNGVCLLRELLDARGPGYVPPASNLEARFEHIMRQAGITTLRRQVDTGDAERWIGRVDFRDSEVPLIVEVQSELHHAALIDEIADAQRIAALKAAGFVVQPVWDVDIWHHPNQVVHDVRLARLTESASDVGEEG